MEEVKQINIKNRTYNFYNDMINLKNFEPNLLKIDKKSYKNVGIYYIGYIAIKKIDDYENVYNANSLHFRDSHTNGYIEEKNEKKYLIFDSTDENKELLKKYSDVWNEIKNKVEAISSGDYDYEKDYMKIKFISDDDLPLNKPLKLYMVTIIIGFVFEEDGKLYPQVFLNDALY